jgi:hypothetical protein
MLSRLKAGLRTIYAWALEKELPPPGNLWRYRPMKTLASGFLSMTLMRPTSYRTFSWCSTRATLAEYRCVTNIFG